jgi:membrane-associated PAP2 superfamily phosphatase
MTSPGHNYRLRWLLLWPVLLWLATTITWELSGWDIPLSDLVANGRQGFPAQHAWWSEGLLHNWSKPIIPAIAISAALISIAAIWLPRLRPWWKPALYVALTIAISTGIVGLLKDTTNRFPPWSIDRYGGSVPHNELWQGTPPGVVGKSGKGWPAGHAAGGFSLIGLWFVARRRQLARAWVWALPAVLIGSAFAVGQHWRGAHFASHNLYSIAICWVVAVLLDHWLLGRWRPPGLAPQSETTQPAA